jgi:hypothetical protein
MMLTKQQEYALIGSTIRGMDGLLSLSIAPLDEHRLLIVRDGKLNTIRLHEVRQCSARCDRCAGRIWWWMPGEDEPWCRRCVPPQAEQIMEILRLAHDFADRASNADALHRCLDAALQLDCEWTGIQKMAFGQRSVHLIERWAEQHEP